MLKKYYIYPRLPVLFDFPFVGIDSTVDIYTIFDIGTMRVLSLSINKLSKECPVLMLSEEKSFTSVAQIKSGLIETCRGKRRLALLALNNFLKKTSPESPGPEFNFEFTIRPA